MISKIIAIFEKGIFGGILEQNQIILCRQLHKNT